MYTYIYIIYMHTDLFRTLQTKPLQSLTWLWKAAVPKGQSCVGTCAGLDSGRV